jgi:plastocyanin
VSAGRAGTAGAGTVVGMPAARRALFLLAAATVALTACSNTESPVNRTGQSGSATASEVGGVQQITIEAGDDYRFHPSTFTVHPGRVQVILKHTGTGAPHNWSLTGFPADFVPLASAGQTKMATFDAPSKPGRYQFVCTIHIKQGQVGTMIVAAP